jgi:hypothetical protein
MSDRPILEQVGTQAQNMLPVTYGISGLTLLGITFQDWVFIATAFLVLLQIVTMMPKAYQVIVRSINRRKRKRDRE